MIGAAALARLEQAPVVSASTLAYPRAGPGEIVGSVCMSTAVLIRPFRLSESLPRPGHGRAIQHILPEPVDSEELNAWKRGFTPQAEIWNGRLAMIGLSAGLAVVLLVRLLSGS